MASTTVIRKLVVEVVEARNLLPKDGHGTSSPYAVLDFHGQRRRTRTVRSDLNPVWNEPLDFLLDEDHDDAHDPGLLEVEVVHDRRAGATRRNNFLGRVRIGSSQFVRQGEEALVYFPLERRSFFSWVRGEIGLRIYYVDDVVGSADPAPPPDASIPTPVPAEQKPHPSENPEPPKDSPPTPPAVEEDQPSPPPPIPPDTPQPAEAASPPPTAAEPEPKTPEPEVPPPPPPPPPPETGKEDPPPSPAPAPAAAPKQMTRHSYKTGFSRGGQRVLLRPGSEMYEPGPQERVSWSTTYDLVDKMHYLFVRVVRARSLPASASFHPIVRLAVSSGREVQSDPARRITKSAYEWDQTFAFGGSALESSATLEVAVWDLQPNQDTDPDDDSGFLGGVCFDVAEVPTRDPPDSPLAPQWYRLEGGGAHKGDLMLATWIGTQADELFADAWKTDAVGAQKSRSKVYLSPKLWYLRATVLEAQDLISPLGLTAAITETGFSVRAQLGFQILKTRTALNSSGTPVWNEDLLFVASEPFGETRLAFVVETRTGMEKSVLGVAEIPLSGIERRIDDRKVVSRWVDLSSPPNGKGGIAGYAGRLHLRACFDGGYHVMDEPAHVSSDFRPTARQLWKPAIGTVELGVIGCRNLIPVKAVAGKGTADAYAVAKYGDKWVQSRTISDCLNPKWNEQYTWQVYDPCTVLTVAVLDSQAPPIDEPKDAMRPDIRIGKVRIRISTLENRRAYKCMYPLVLLLPTGPKRMGEIELGIRFTRAISAMDVLHVYTRPVLPRMHYLRPIGVAHQEALRGVAARIVAVHLSRSEPPLPREVALYMLDAESQGFSMRKVRANWARIVNILSRPFDVMRWLDDTRSWKNPTATLMAHALLVLFVWHPDLVVPTLAIYVFGVGTWNYRGRSRGPTAQLCARLSQVETAEREELDEEFDTVPSSRPADIARVRYDKLRTLGARVQTMLGDLATQGERVQALVTWRDPRATLIFVAMCLAIAVLLYVVPAKMVAMAAGFYYLRHPMFRDRMPPAALNFFRRLPSLADCIM